MGSSKKFNIALTLLIVLLFAIVLRLTLINPLDSTITGSTTIQSANLIDSLVNLSESTYLITMLVLNVLLILVLLNKKGRA
jgi:ATP/ADP translocase